MMLNSVGLTSMQNSDTFWAKLGEERNLRMNRKMGLLGLKTAVDVETVWFTHETVGNPILVLFCTFKDI